MGRVRSQIRRPFGRSVRTLWGLGFTLSPYPLSRWTPSPALRPNPRSPVFKVRSLITFPAVKVKNLAPQGGCPSRGHFGTHLGHWRLGFRLRKLGLGVRRPGLRLRKLGSRLKKSGFEDKSVDPWSECLEPSRGGGLPPPTPLRWTPSPAFQPKPRSRVFKL